jgi:Domain of unknown function (DUF4260)
MLEGRMKRLLQIEGLALLLGSVVAYQWLSASWWMFLALFFVPDLSFAAYLLGPRMGAFGYNIMHSTLGPFLLAGVSWWFGPGVFTSITAPVAAIWFAHVGFDRILGYGLKYTTGFKNTHLGKL